MNKIKVLYVLHSSGIFEGSNKSFLNMLKGLLEKNIKAKIILPKEGPICEEFEKLNVSYTIIPYGMQVYPPFLSFKNKLSFLFRLTQLIVINKKATKSLIKIIRRFNPNLIHTNVGPVHVGYKAALKTAKPHVWHIREYQILDFKKYPIFSMHFFKKKLRNEANYSISITKGLYNYFELKQEQSKVIYNPVLSLSDINFVKEKSPYFLFAGRIQELKGIEELLYAFAKFCKSELSYKLLIAGDTTNQRYLNFVKKIIEENNIQNRVEFLGMREDIYSLMAQATALIVPSVFEGFGRITAEAMFQGCLVIGNNTAGTKEILEEQNLGILYTGIEQLTDVMLAVVQRGINCYYPQIQRAQEYAVKNFSIDQHVQAVWKFYHDILRKNNLYE